MGKLRPERSRDRLRGSQAARCGASPGALPWRSTHTLPGSGPPPGDTDGRTCRGVVSLISHAMFGVSPSLGELENVTVQVFLSTCLRAGRCRENAPSPIGWVLPKQAPGAGRSGSFGRGPEAPRRPSGPRRPTGERPFISQLFREPTVCHTLLWPLQGQQ